MRKILAFLLAFLLPVLTVGCVQTDENAATYSTTGSSVQDSVSAKGKTVGIAVPNHTVQRWLDDTEKLSAGLKEIGCQVQVLDAQDDAALQASQIADLIAKPVDCLIVAAVDSLALTAVLQQAKEAGIPVIAYDRLLMNTDAATCYVGFDDLATGTAIANYIVKEKGLETAANEKRSYTIEFFMGSAEDNNAVLLYQGIMPVLQPYLDSGVLVCRTGRTAFEDVCTQDWSGEYAKADCERYLSDFYADKMPDILCTASDSIAAGCYEALKSAEYAQDQSWPLITGQNGTLEGVKRILSGHQGMTMYKDHGVLVQNCLLAADRILTLAPLQNGTASCHNGVMLVPAILTVSVAVDGDNYREVLINSGVFSETQLTEKSE